MLAAFNVLAEATPLVQFGYSSANMALLFACASAPKIHLIDIGIGSGRQWLPFLDALAARPNPRPHVRITGIDVPGAPDDPAHRLVQTGDTLRRHAAQRGIDLHFEPIAAVVEDLDFSQIELQDEETLLVNAAFALHHVPAADAVEDPTRSRDAVLSRLQRLPMRVLTLVEPDSEHNRLAFLPRVAEARSHYRIVFEALEALLPADLPEREVLEDAFFGREILNIIAGEGEQRVERHERYESWRGRMRRQGFAPVDLTWATGGLRHGLSLQAGFSIQEDHDAVRLAWKGKPLIAASAWRPLRCTPSCFV